MLRSSLCLRGGPIVAAVVFTVCLAGCGAFKSKVTKANFDKINNGMTRAEVESILGEPSSGGGDGSNVAGQFGVDVGASAPPPTTVDYVWESGKKSITVTFTQGKVTQKKSSGL